MFPSTKDFANYADFPFYDTGTECLAGHTSLRYANGGGCAMCMKLTAVKYHINKRSATPQWADENAISDVYLEARRLSALTGIRHDVDHEIPLNGKNVCGLHVENNLRVITQTENVRKSNKYVH
jgi:hypothetical protein